MVLVLRPGNGHEFGPTRVSPDCWGSPLSVQFLARKMGAKSGPEKSPSDTFLFASSSKIYIGNALAKAELGVKPPVSSLAGRLGIKLILWTTNTDLLDIHVHAAAYTLTRDPPYKVEATLQENTMRDSQDLKKRTCIMHGPAKKKRTLQIHLPENTYAAFSIHARTMSG